MINQNLFGSIIAPSWHQIDYIHFGPKTTLTDINSLLVGRYLLVKYVEDQAYAQNYKQDILLKSELTAEEATWKKCYLKDAKIILGEPTEEEIKKAYDYNSSLDCDGIIYQKQYKNNKIIFMPIANLNIQSSSQSGTIKWKEF